MKATLKQAREFARRRREDPLPAAASHGRDPGGPLDEEALKERRRLEREEEHQARREAAAHNAELGAACLKHLARLRVDERVVRVLSAFDLGGELDRVALRGARYGLPGWVGQEQRRDGGAKAAYLDRAGAEEKAREFLRCAKTAAEMAGRQVVLLAMARHADERAVARSSGSFHALAPGRQLPWSGEAIDLLDDLCRERLPAHVLDRGREDREREATERAKEREDSAWYEERLAALGGLGGEERRAVLAEAGERLGQHDPRGWRLRQRVERLEAGEGGEARTPPSIPSWAARGRPRSRPRRPACPRPKRAASELAHPHPHLRLGRAARRRDRRRRRRAIWILERDPRWERGGGYGSLLGLLLGLALAIVDAGGG